jgi:hypothetical protein
LSPALKAAAAVLKIGFVFAYVDGVSIAGPAEALGAALEAFESFLNEPGIRINTAKSFITSWTFRIFHLQQQIPQFTTSLQQFTTSPDVVIY